MRGVRIAGAFIVAAMAAGAGVLPASADSTSRPGALSTVSRQTDISLAVPPGVIPTALTGVLSMPSIVEGSSVSILANGRVAATIPATLYTLVSVPLLPTDVVADGTILITLRYDAPLGAVGCTPPPDITLRKLGLDYTGVETPPDSVESFFPDDAARIDVRVPRDTSDDVLQAALNAVAALSHRYPVDTPVVLSATDTPLPTYAAGQRVVNIVESGAPVSTTLSTDSGLPALIVSGSGLPLADAARDLGREGGVVERDDALTQSFADLRGDAPALRASSAGTELLDIRQDSFGGPVSSLDVHLEGTHSAVPPEAQARLDVYLDDELVGSSVLGTNPVVDLDLTIPADRLRSASVLRASINAAADNALACSPALPLELSLDEAASTLTATPGTGDERGFELFPQSLDGRLPVALRADGTTKFETALDAAALVGALQRDAAAPLAVTIVDPDVFLAGDDSGLIVGALDADSVALNAPLRLSGTEELAADRERFQVGSEQPFAALQALTQSGRSVLMLGSWAPGDGPAPPALSRRVVERVAGPGWSSLDGDVLVADTGTSPYTVDSGTRPVVSEPPAAERSYVPYFAVAIAVLLLGLAVQLVRAVRRDRRDPPAGATPVDRDEEHDEEHDETEGDDEDELVGDLDDDLDELSELDDEHDQGYFPGSADVSTTLSRGRQPRVNLNRR